jgi:hypothetical protein
MAKRGGTGVKKYDEDEAEEDEKDKSCPISGAPDVTC